MTKEQRRARRDIMNPPRRVKPVKIKRSWRCKCETPFYCHKHGR